MKNRVKTPILLLAVWSITALAGLLLVSCAPRPAPAPAPKLTPAEKQVVAPATKEQLPAGEGSLPTQPPVKSITTLVEKLAKTLDWSDKNNKIVFEKWGEDGYVDIFVINPDGTNEKSLTSNKPGCPQKHNGNAAWHPSTDYIVFTAEKEENPKELGRWAIPGSGFNCDLWVMTSDGKKFYQLTDYALHTRCIIHPHFSHDGKKLFWAERWGKSAGSSWGEWALKIADFAFVDEKPYLKNIESYQPGQNHYFYESHAFTRNDKKILFCANPEGQSDTGFDIYEMDIETQRLTNLTSSPNEWDEHAHYSPDGKRVAWMSSTGLDIEYKAVAGGEWAKYLKTELWVMNSDGSNKQRLTYFNKPGHPHYLGTRTIVSDITWSPDGNKIAALVAYGEAGSSRLQSKIVIIELR